jgi:hypothetical protein
LITGSINIPVKNYLEINTILNALAVFTAIQGGAIKTVTTQDGKYMGHGVLSFFRSKRFTGNI